jgi:hypothetical protein
MMAHANGLLHEPCLTEQPVQELPLILETAVLRPDLILPQACVWKEEAMVFLVHPKHHQLFLRP